VAWVALCLLLIVLVTPAAAQGGVLVAFVNTSGQLIVSDNTGGYRWIVTNPGEYLVDPVGYSWSPDGQALFFAVDIGGVASLRFGDVNGMNTHEVGQVSTGGLSGGSWDSSSGGVIVSADNVIRYYGVGGDVFDIVGGQAGASVFSPYSDNRPNLPAASALSPDGRFLFYQQSDGRYAVMGLNGGGAFPLPGVNDPNTRQSGLWADGAPFVAYWGYEGNAILSVTNAENGQTVTLDSGRAAPITPILWRPGTTQLLYRGATGYVQAADVSCLFNGCGANPLDSGVQVLPPTAGEIQTDGSFVYYQDGTTVFALPFSCIDSTSCGTGAVIGSNAAPGTLVSINNRLLAYTGYASNPNDVNDRVALFVALDGCQAGGCTAFTSIAGAQTGLVAPDGSTVVVDQVGVGMNAVNVFSGQSGYLSDSLGQQGLALARWG